MAKKRIDGVKIGKNFVIPSKLRASVEPDERIYIEISRFSASNTKPFITSTLDQVSLTLYVLEKRS